MLGTWVGWSEDATEAPRCFGSAASFRCSPSPQTRADWRSPRTVACRDGETFIVPSTHQTVDKDDQPETSPKGIKIQYIWFDFDHYGGTEITLAIFLTWRWRGWSESALTGLHSAAAEPGLSPPGTRSFGPAQKCNTTTAQCFIHHVLLPCVCLCACVCVCVCACWDSLFEPTTFSRSEIFFSCWCICWFFISTTSFKLFRSFSMCWYGAKASCYSHKNDNR